MLIKGFQKLTLLDFPEKTACTVFTAGCNLRCPFCHNALLVTKIDDTFVKEEEFFSWLETRKGKLDGVAITGGEPLMQKDIDKFIAKIAQMGFLVKLDTNGFFPDKLAEILASGNVEYVAMDIKNSLDKYAQTVETENLNLELVKKSINIIMNSGVDYEFRTTVTHELFDETSFDGIATLIKGAKRYFIQSFKDSGNLIKGGSTAEDKQILEKYRDKMRKFVDYCEIRGV